jgi:type I restriction enzyme S subunit
VSVATIELGQVCRLDRRVTAASEALGKGLEFVGMEHVDPESGRIVLGQGSRTGEGKGQAFLFDERHVLFGKLRPYLRKIALPGQSGCASTELVPLLPDAARLDRGYLFHWVRRRHVIDALMAKNTGARMPRADMSVLLDMAIPLPPLDEQRRIVGLLDRAAEIRRRADAARAKARAIIPALFLDMFGDPATNPKGWPTRPLGDVASVGSGAGFPKADQGQHGQQFPFLKVSDMNLPGNEVRIIAWNNTVSDKLRRKLGAKAFAAGSIIFPKIGAAIGTNKKRVLSVPSCVDNNVMAVSFGEQVDISFGLSLFQSKNISDFASASDPPSMRKTSVEEWSIPLPPLPLQTAFAEQAQRLEATARALDAAAAKAEAMTAGLSAEVFG